MKKSVVLSFLLIAIYAVANAQSNETLIKSNIKQDKKELHAVTQAKKEERKALKKLEGEEASYQAKGILYRFRRYSCK